MKMLPYGFLLELDTENVSKQSTDKKKRKSRTFSDLDTQYILSVTQRAEQSDVCDTFESQHLNVSPCTYSLIPNYICIMSGLQVELTRANLFVKYVSLRMNL